jgi:hypothetical protein
MVIDGFLDRSQITGYPEVDFVPPVKSAFAVSSLCQRPRQVYLARNRDASMVVILTEYRPIEVPS